MTATERIDRLIEDGVVTFALFGRSVLKAGSRHATIQVAGQAISAQGYGDTGEQALEAALADLDTMLAKRKSRAAVPAETPAPSNDLDDLLG